MGYDVITVHYCDIHRVFTDIDYLYNHRMAQAVDLYSVNGYITLSEPEVGILIFRTAAINNY